ncbi:MAG: F420-0--gamma-glutamyl ligase [Cenarchaeum symbiont of Oopsacas minuta]|nr:F420-0--gamma-glutamyl ligase [Cenarchaeum symbiont of Oopsacas minuta]
MSIEVLPVHIDGEIVEGQNIIESAKDLLSIQNGDIVVISQKIISKQEGRMISLDSVKPTGLASGIASAYGKDSRIVQLILDESSRIVRMRSGILIMETNSGLVCANAGIDESNVQPGCATLLPIDSDASAARLRRSILEKTGKNIAVIISDTFGRPFRMGQTDCAIGSAGIRPIVDYTGMQDSFGRTLRVTAIAVADQICAAAELVSKKTTGSPITIVRGYVYESTECDSSDLLRTRSEDLFR